jgi:chromosomal replication initiator protein
MRDPDRTIWKDTLAHLRRAHPTLCRQWFDEIELVGIDGGSMILRAHTAHHRDYLRRHCLDQFNDSVRTVTGRLLGVRFIGPDDVSPLENRPGSPTALESEMLDPPTATIPPPDGGRAAETPFADAGWGAHPAPNGSHAGSSAAGAAEGFGGAGAHAAYAPRGPEARPPSPARYYASEAEPLGPGSLVINPDYDFENFIVGPSNRIAHAAGLAVASSPGRAYNPLFIHGPVGLGKTHLLQAICLGIRKANPGAAIQYLSCEAFITDFVDRVRSGAMAEFRHRFRAVDVLVIDDIHFLTKREQTQEEFFHTFNTLHQAHKQIVLSSDRPPEEIEALQDRLVSRFKWGLVAVIDPPQFETRVAILKSKALLRGLDLPDNVAVHVARRVTANIRELEGAIGKLQLQAMVDGGPIDLAMCERVIGPAAAASQGDITVQSIVEAVIEYYDVRVADLVSAKRQRSIAVPRQICMFLAREHTRHSLEEIGDFFGGRDHTTVMHAVRTVRERREVNREFQEIVKNIEASLLAARR